MNDTTPNPEDYPVVLLKQHNASFRVHEDDPYFTYTQVRLVRLFNGDKQAEVIHPCGLHTYPDIAKVFKMPVFETIL